MQLVYLKGSREMGEDFGIDSRIWNVIAPRLNGYDYSRGFPSLGILGLKERGLI